MSTSQRARSGVPLDRRSALASVPGVPAWGAVAIAVGASFLGFVIDAARGSDLTKAFACFYVIGVVAAVVLVRYRGLFTAMVQAPLVLFVAVPLSYQYFTDNPGTSLKDILLNVAIPLVNRFPLMLLGTLLALAIGGARIFLKRQSSHAPTGAAKRTVRDRARETRDRAKDNRERMRARRATADADAPTTVHDRIAPEVRRAPDSRRATEGRRAAESRRAPEAGRAPEARRARRDAVSSEPPRRQTPRPTAPRVPRPPEVDPYAAPRASAPTTRGAHIPPHPVPQVRYRDRGDA